jgi:hypothetical protein
MSKETFPEVKSVLLCCVFIQLIWFDLVRLGSTKFYIFLQTRTRKPLLPSLAQMPQTQNKEKNQKGHSFDVRRSRRHRPAYPRERTAAMFLGNLVPRACDPREGTHNWRTNRWEICLRMPTFCAV